MFFFLIELSSNPLFVLAKEYWAQGAGALTVTTLLYNLPRFIRGTKKTVAALSQIKRGLDKLENFIAVAEKLTPETIDRLGQLAEEFRPNGGNSMADRITRIEMRLIALQSQLGVNDATRRAVLNASGQAYWECDATGAYIFVTKRMAELIGVSREEALGNGWATNIHPDDEQDVFDAWQRAITQKRSFVHTYRFLVNGEVRQVQAQTEPIIANGEMAGYLGRLTQMIN